MAAALAIFKFVAKAALGAVGAGIISDFAVDVLPEIANDVWQWWGKGRPVDQLRQELQEVAQLAPVEVARQAEQAVAEEAAGRPETERAALTAYLSLIPSSIRQSQRRLSDPTGRTMSRGLSLVKPDDVVPLLPPRLPRFKPGDRPPGIGDLELVEMLGAGGFGEVWKARNPYFDGLPPVALKFCLDPAAKDSLLHHEAAVLTQVMRQGKHPGIVPLIHTYFRADPPCLEYEYVAGGDLSAIIRDSRPGGGLPPRQAGCIVQEVAEAVGFAHRLTPPIVHRDLKPANILVQRTADGKLAFRVADFGIGGVASAQAISQTRLGGTRGQFLFSSLRGSYTPLYASPQQMQGGPPDPRDDVYSLGVIWHQLLTGNLAAGAPAGLDWPDDRRQRGMTDQAIQLLASCFSDVQERRPRDATVLAEGITAIIKPPPPVPPSPPSPSSLTESVFAQDMKDAVEELRTKGNNRAYFKRQGPSRIGVWQAAALQGDRVAQWLLARCLQEGTGAPKDAQAGVSWLRRAAESGLAVAQTDLGDCYYLGEGVKADSSEAFRLYTKAAEQGFTEAQVDLGDCYYEGKGVAKDPAEAARHYRMGAEAGWARGQNSLGDCYYEGCGVEQDYPQAIGWYRNAADQGLASAQLNLGWCYGYGRGVKKNRGEAVKWYHKAAEQNNVVAQYSLGYCYELGYGVEPDLALAEQWYRKAADQGHKKAKNALKRLLKRENTEPVDDDGSEQGTAYFLNTNYSNDPVDHEDMLQKKKAAAYFDPWKYKIEQLSKDDTVFLYQSGVGVVAIGYASGTLHKAAYHGDPKHIDEEYFMTLEGFERVEPPVTAATIKDVTGRNHVFMQTMFAVDADAATALIEYIQKRSTDTEPPGTKPIREGWLKSMRLLLEKGATSPDSAVKFSTFRVEAKDAGGIMYGYDGLSAAGLIEWIKREDEAGWFLCLTAAGRAALDAKSD